MIRQVRVQEVIKVRATLDALAAPTSHEPATTPTPEMLVERQRKKAFQSSQDFVPIAERAPTQDDVEVTAFVSDSEKPELASGAEVVRDPDHDSLSFDGELRGALRRRVVVLRRFNGIRRLISLPAACVPARMIGSPIAVRVNREVIDRHSSPRE